MSHPMLEALDNVGKPVQLIRLDRKIKGRVGEEVVKSVKFVIHEEDEQGMTLRFVELEGGEGSNAPENGSPRAGTSGMIIPSPSA